MIANGADWKLIWSLFIVHVSGAKERTAAQMTSFDDAGGCGSEPYIGEEAARARLC
jgi:hypothetical protein